MKADISRLWRRNARYASVLMQQGRLSLDADWNDFAALVLGRAEMLAADLIGTGAPETDAGFELFRRGGIDFSGDQYIQVPRVSFDSQADYTIEFFAKPRKDGTVVATGNLDCDILFTRTKDGLRVLFRARGLECSAAVLRDGVFVHIAAVATNKRIALYVNGEFAASAIENKDGTITAIAGVDSSAAQSDARFGPTLTSSIAQPIALAMSEGRIAAIVSPPAAPPITAAPAQGPAAGTSALYFGARSGPINGFNGLIAGIQIWNVVRSGEQIRQSRNLWLRCPSDKGLIAYWPMSYEMGTVVEDVVGDAHGNFGAGNSAKLPVWDTNKLCIAPGRLYVNGALCRVEHAIPLDEQPGSPRLPNLSSSTSNYVAYLDVRKTLVTWLEDPSIREVALGGADTTARIENAWTVRLAEAKLDEWQKAQKSQKPRLQMTPSRQPNQYELLGNDLYRVEICSAGEPSDDPGTNDSRVEIQLKGSTITLATKSPPFDPGQMVEVIIPAPEKTELRSIAMVVATAQDGELTSLTVDPPPKGPVSSDATSSKGTMRRIASFKWSRENGSEAFQVSLPASGQPANVLTLIQSTASEERPSKDDWVELTIPGVTNLDVPQPLFRVIDVSSDYGTITLDTFFKAPGITLPASAPQAFLRRWNVSSDEAVRGCSPLRVRRAQLLEHGIQVNFENQGGAEARVGDYWVMPARQLTGLIEWPAANGVPIALPPDGPNDIEVPIAEIVFSDKGDFTIRDLRRSIQIVTSDKSPPSMLDKRKDPTGQSAPPPPPLKPSNPWIEVAPGNTTGWAIALARSNDSILVITEKSWSVFDPAKRTFTKTGPIPDPRTEAAVVLVENTMYVIGGKDRSGTPMVDVHTLDLTSGSWDTTTPLPKARYGHAAVVLRGKIYVAGGIVKGAASDSLIIFNPQTEIWDTSADPMNTARTRGAAAAVGGQFVIMGGIGEDGVALSDAEEYDPRTLTWTGVSPLSMARARIAAATLGNRTFAIGGAIEKGATNRVDVLDPDTKVFSPGPSLPEPRFGASAAVSRDTIYLFGDDSSTKIAPVLALPVGNTSFIPSEPETTGGTSANAEGLDVSHYQGNVDWNAVASNGVTFAFAKATEGNTITDSEFSKNWEAMKTARIVRGAYHFFQPSIDAAAQADHFLATVSSFDDDDLPPVLDIEVAPPQGVDLAAAVKTWLDRVEAKIGCAPMIYVSPSFWNDYLNDQFGRYPLWVAHYGVDSPAIPKGWTTWTFWQYTNSGTVPGIAGKVDRDKSQNLAAAPRIRSKIQPGDENSPIPPRTTKALTGTAFGQEVKSLSQPERDARVLGELLNGNVPGFLRQFIKITAQATIDGKDHTIEYDVMPDYLSIGSDQDYLRMPMSPLTAQAAGDVFECMLPTPLMVKQIYDAASVKVEPTPFSPEQYDIQSVEVFMKSNDVINGQLARAQARLGKLVGGQKKDVVTTVALATNPGKVAIYGWQMASNEFGGNPIQKLSTAHNIDYMDYSHGLRLVRKVVQVNGEPMSLMDVLADEKLCKLVSDEGPVKQPRYVGQAPAPNPPAPNANKDTPQP